MKKIISLFQRNYDTDRFVRNEVVPGAEWVLAGEGVPTRKYDGTACMIRDGKLFARFDCKGSKKKPLKEPPPGFEPSTEEYAPGEPFPNDHLTGWVPVTDHGQFKWHREAWDNNGFTLPNGTYELVGPKVNGNADEFGRHQFVQHGKCVLDDARVGRSFASIRAYLQSTNIEGIVWHHLDGRMVKIKRRDFGFEWPAKKESA